jgi:hypothetical protein
MGRPQAHSNIAIGASFPAWGEIDGRSLPTVRLGRLPCPGTAGAINGETHHGSRGHQSHAAVGLAHGLLRHRDGDSGGITGPICEGPVRGQDDQGATEYQGIPSGIYSCATCTLFVAPNACKVVEGEVSPDGWCKAYAMAD